MRRLYVDIETFSSVDLFKYGVYPYAASPDFQILMAGWRWLDTDEAAWATLTEAETRAVLLDALLDDDVLLVAHNAQFERVCFSALLSMAPGTYLPPEKFHDTMAVAAEHGHPVGLDRLARSLRCTPKDPAGTALINFFCKPNRKGERNLPEDHPEKWSAFVAYCLQDVDTLAEVDAALGDFPTETERQVFLVDQHINDRGIRIDAALARRAVAAAEANRFEQELRVMYLTGISNPASTQQFLQWCQTAISPKIKDMTKGTIAKVLTSPRLSPVQREVLELRQELALVASKKFATALAAMGFDERLRGTLKFFRAHTGRWAGTGTQVHNLPREQFSGEDGDHDAAAENAAILDLWLGLGASSLDLKKLVRSMFLVDGTVVDYASIEARVIAWLAGEQWALAAFRAGRDIYVETAERMGGLTRAQGKVAVLALGYQGWINSLRAMGAEGTDEELAFLAGQWRRANPSIVRLWADLADAIGAAQEGPVHVGRHITVTRSAETMRIHLPSGRAITYHGVRWERFKVQDPETGVWKRKEGWRYDDPKKPGVRISTYGGRLAENVTQAVARDIMAEALVRLHRAGLEPVAHVHDEILVQGTSDVARVTSIMCEIPKWAGGLPIDGEGFTTYRYKKG